MKPDATPTGPALRQIEGPPSGYFLVIPESHAAGGFDLARLLQVLRASWKLLAWSTVASAGLAAGLSLLLQDVFSAQTMVNPVSSTGRGIGSALQSDFGGLAALAGINLDSNSGQKEEFLATLSSSGFSREFVLRQGLMPILYSDRWDARLETWRPGVKPPTVEAAVKRFMKAVRHIFLDRKTGLVTVTMDWYSPQLAASWANQFVAMANDKLRTRAIQNADRSIEYLNKELAKTDSFELRQSIYRLIEEQVNQAMLANVQREYAFRTIDVAISPEEKSRPHRSLITAAGALVGLLLSAFVANWRSRKQAGARPL